MKKKIFTTVFCAFCSVLALQAQDLYQIGDIVDFNGVKGYVYKVSSNGRHGYAISLAAFESKKLCTDKALQKKRLKTTEDDGAENAKIVEKFATDNGKTLAIFPAYEWAKSLGEGWYIPSVAEMKEVLTILSTKPEGYPDDGEAEEASEESADQSVAQGANAGSIGIDYKKYTIKISTKAKKFVNNTSDKFKEEGGSEFLKNQNFNILMTSTICDQVPLKYAAKFSKEYKADPEAAMEKYSQYMFGAYVIYVNDHPASAISVFANFAFGGSLKTSIYWYQMQAKTDVRAIYKF